MSQRQGPLRLGPLEIRLSADFSKETADQRRAFLSLRHLDVKFGLFEPARMWITMNACSSSRAPNERDRKTLGDLHLHFPVLIDPPFRPQICTCPTHPTPRRREPGNACPGFCSENNAWMYKIFKNYEDNTVTLQKHNPKY
ncbi:hypothetical protein NDU88_007697 [Pleurodeles waltl]|uniref:Uncharacterized protein n=1 Tax=Pleurodeles waltl TaxID=8319 RepID=A0AAV7ST22_PLEWA|nr:hypothetical protein NDU88_007697 [Pleurodeles waltl]